jgi:hypothetical protein
MPDARTRPSPDQVELEARAHELRERAEMIAAPLRAAAAAQTTLACERAMLRLFGVGGLDRDGRPLALEVSERLAALGPARLGGGISLPFAAAADEYDLEPQALALEIAHGNVDLGLEAELLREPERRAAAERRVREWLASAWQRFDANRVARAELRQLLGDMAATPIGVELAEATAGEAAEAAARLVAAGADAIWVRVPRDRELRRGLGEELEPADATQPTRLAPAGSQRGLALLREALDEAGLEARRYIRLASSSLGLAAPEQAVVAGLERVDVVASDPVASIIEFGVQPARAFADHQFALRLHARSGVQLVLGAGPMATAPELARGLPADPASQAGRALALQAVSVALSSGQGIPPERILLGAVPPLARDAALAGQALAEVSLRRLVFSEHGLIFREPQAAGSDGGWTAWLQAWLAGGPRPAGIVRLELPARSATALDEVRNALAGAAILDEGREVGPLQGPALAHARATLQAALAALRQLASEGWDALARVDGLASSATSLDPWLAVAQPVERRGEYDPLAEPPMLP